MSKVIELDIKVSPEVAAMLSLKALRQIERNLDLLYIKWLAIFDPAMKGK